MMEEGRGTILTEEQLQRSIEAGQWYESEGESGSEEVEEEDSSLQLSTHEQVRNKPTHGSDPRDQLNYAWNLTFVSYLKEYQMN